jgi:hypothetical protein
MSLGFISFNDASCVGFRVTLRRVGMVFMLIVIVSCLHRGESSIRTKLVSIVAVRRR